jgi:Ca-activated chloride channel homolog
VSLSPAPVSSQGQAPTVDVGSTNTGVNVDQEFIKRIAVARPVGRGGASRSFESLAEVAPGGPSDRYIDGLASRESPRQTPSWALPYLHIVVPDGTPQTVYRAPDVTDLPYTPPPPVPERTVAPTGQRFYDMYFQGYGVNPTVDTEEERFSTFSVDTDSASYTLTRAYLERGSLPDERAVRVEEFVNTFDYGDAGAPDAPFGVHVEGFPSPARKGYQVVRLGVKAKQIPRAQRKPAHLVFVIDVSGSMNLDSRLGLVKRALRLLVNELDERDSVSLVVYGDEARRVLPPTNASHKGLLLAAIDGLQPEGSTNAQAGLEMGYALAAEHLLEGGINRVILCSDGVANNGLTDADGLWARVKDRAAAGITLSTVGFGMGNYNDVLMERLAQVGEGNYAYVDRLAEARRIFVKNLGGTLQVVAKDVKLQVEFDRKTVSRYRLLGYENRQLTRQQFSDDSVDAGEVGSGHAVTALYEVKLRDASRPALGTLRIRYKAPEGGASQLLEQPLASSVLRPAYAQATGPTRLAYVASAFAEKLRGSYWARPLTWDALLGLWEGLDAPLKARDDVAELGRLLRTAKTLDHREDRFESFAPVRTMDADRVPTFKK